MLLQHFAGSGARDVHRDVAAADHDHFLADGEAVAEVRVEQEIDPLVDAVEVHAGDGKIAAAVRAHRDHDGVETLFAQFADREVAPGGRDSA